MTPASGNPTRAPSALHELLHRCRHDAALISALTVSTVTFSTSTVTFVTNEPSGTQLDCGTTSAYGTLSTLQPALGTTQAQTLTGLAPGTTHYVLARSRDFSGTSRSRTATRSGPRTCRPSSHRSGGSITTDQIFSFRDFDPGC
jgi:hypothetical protein